HHGQCELGGGTMKRWMVTPAGVWKAVLKKPLVLAVNVLGMPVLFAGLWGWLYLPVSSIPLVLLSVVLLVALVASLLLLMVFTYNSYYAAQHPLQPISSEGIHLLATPLAERALAAVPATFLCFVVFGLSWSSITWVCAYTRDWAKLVASSRT